MKFYESLKPMSTINKYKYKILSIYGTLPVYSLNCVEFLIEWTTLLPKL